MKNYLSALSLVTSIFIFQACNNGSASNNTDHVDSANNINDSVRNASDSILKANDNVTTPVTSPVIATPVDKDASKFAVNAASGGLMEVELGKLAQQKAIDSRIKNFGTMMVEDHGKANEELKSISTSQNVTLPSAPGDDKQKMINKLMSKNGKDFDKAYMNMMLDDHNEDIKEFKKAADKCTNASLKEFAIKTLPLLQKHLDSAKAITGKK